MRAPYREPRLERTPRGRALDPWWLALFFGWICDAWRIGERLIVRRSVSGELGFAAVLAVLTVLMGIAAVRARRAR